MSDHELHTVADRLSIRAIHALEDQRGFPILHRPTWERVRNGLRDQFERALLRAHRQIEAADAARARARREEATAA